MPRAHLFKEIGTEHQRRAPCTAPALILILDDFIDDLAAVYMIFGEIDAFLPGEILQDAAAQRPEIARDDEIVILRAPSALRKVCKNGIGSRGRHCGAHVVDVRDAIIYDLSDRRSRYADAFAGAAEQGRSGSRHRPLRLRRADAAEFQRIAVLTLRRSKVAARSRYGRRDKSSVQEGRRKQQALCHRGAGPIYPKEGYAEIAC